MTKAEKQAVLDTLDEASIPLGNAFQRACADAGLPPGSLNSFEIAGLNSLGAAMAFIRSLPETENDQ